MKAAELFVQCLENEGVEYIFGLPGEENIHVIEALADSKIEFILAHHEQAAAFMADAYGRLTGKPGICLGTLGPGATNLLTGVANANFDYSPVIVITGQANLENSHKELHQYMDVVGMYKNVTKWTQQIRFPDSIPEIVRKAFHIASEDKPGAVHLELPKDVVTKFSTSKPIPAQPPYRLSPDYNDIRRAAEIINSSKQPLILAGNGIIRNQAYDAFLAFIDSVNIPVVNTFMAKGVLPSNHPSFLHTVGLPADYKISGFEEADLIITIGYDFIEFLPEKWNENKRNKVIHIDKQFAQYDSDYPVDCQLVGDINTSLERLKEHVIPKKFWATLVKNNIEASLFSLNESSGGPVIPQRIMADLKKVEQGNATIISDVGAHKMWMARMYPTERPNQTIISNGFCSMGIAIPGAIATKLVNPDKPVVAVTGDGGFLMNGVELATAKRLGLAFVVLIFNDSKYRLIEWEQLDKFSRSYGVEFQNPNFVDFARSFGVKFQKVSHSDELVPALQDAFALNEVVVVDIDVDYSENIKLTRENSPDQIPAKARL